MTDKKHIEQDSSYSSIFISNSDSYEQRPSRLSDDKNPKANCLQMSIKFLLYTYQNLYYVHIMTIGILLLILSLIITEPSVYISKKGKSPVEIKTYLLLLCLSSVLASFVFFSITFKLLARCVKTKNEKLNQRIYLISEISANISIFILCVTLVTISYCQDINYKIDFLLLEIYLNDAITITFLSNFLFSIFFLLLKSIEFKFTTEIYVDRFLKVTRINFLFKLLKSIYHLKTGYIQISENTCWKKAFNMINDEDIIDNEMNYKNSYKKAFFEQEGQNMQHWNKRKIYEKFSNLPLKQVRRDPQLRFISYKNRKLIRKIKKYSCFQDFSIFRLADLKPYFSDEINIKKFFKLCDLDINTIISEDFLLHLFNNNDLERNCIHKSIRQLKNILKNLRNLGTFVLWILTLAYICIWGFNRIPTAITVFTAVFGTGVAFQNTVKNGINNLMFIFFISPFDVGDRILCTIDNKQENLIVNKIQAFSTLFDKLDGTKMYVPNYLLYQNPIANIRRSGKMAETHIIQVYYDTPETVLKELENRIDFYLKCNSNDFENFFLFNYDSVENVNKLNLKIYIQTKRNWYDYDNYLRLKNYFLDDLKKNMNDLKIKYKLPRRSIKIRNGKKIQ